MRTLPSVGRLLFACGLLVIPLPLARAEGPKQPNPVLAGIRKGLSRSPDVYLAGVIQIVGAPRCEKPEEPASCISDTKLVEVFSSKGCESKKGMLVPFRGAGEIGTKYLAFLVPGGDDPKIYGSTFLAILVSDDDRIVFRSELAAAGLTVITGGEQ